MKKIDFYALDSLFLPYMPDTSLKFNNLSEVSKYNLNAGQKLYNFIKIIKLNHHYKDSITLLVRPAQIQYDNLQELLLWRQIKRSERNINSMNLLSFFSPYSKSTNLKERIQLYNSFPENLKNSETGKKTWARIQQYAFDKNIDSDIKQFQNIKLTDTNKNLLQFKDIFDTTHRFFILVFGASWCLPCRLEETQLKHWVPLVDTTKIKILGLSIDKDPKKWIEYLREDKLPWNSYLLQNEMDNLMIKKFKFEGIPMNFLISKEGKVAVQNTDIRKILLHLADTKD